MYEMEDVLLDLDDTGSSREWDLRFTGKLDLKDRYFLLGLPRKHW